MNGVCAVRLKLAMSHFIIQMMDVKWWEKKHTRNQNVQCHYVPHGLCSHCKLYTEFVKMAYSQSAGL